MQVIHRYLGFRARAAPHEGPDDKNWDNIPENLEIKLEGLVDILSRGGVHGDYKVNDVTNGYLNLACRLYIDDMLKLGTLKEHLKHSSNVI